MGKTHKDRIRGKYKSDKRKSDKEFDLVWKKLYKGMPGECFEVIWRLCKVRTTDPWDDLTEEQKLIIINYSKNPSWWNRLFNNRPARKKDKTLCIKIKNKSLLPDIDNTDFSVPKKPDKYYW